VITVPPALRDERHERIAAALCRIEQILDAAGWPWDSRASRLLDELRTLLEEEDAQ
jgi:hypothetical protein